MRRATLKKKPGLPGDRRSWSAPQEAAASSFGEEIAAAAFRCGAS